MNFDSVILVGTLNFMTLVISFRVTHYVSSNVILYAFRPQGDVFFRRIRNDVQADVMHDVKCPYHLRDMLTVAAPARPMRSAGAPLLFVPRVRTVLARPAFSVAGLTVFNSLTS